MKLWSKWMKKYCQLVALVGLPVLERLLDGDQLRGLQGVQILAFQMPASSQGTGYPNQNLNIHTSSELIKGTCSWKLEANLWNRNTDLSSICMLSFSFLTLSISALRL
jgi:hypothetical protein